MAAGVDRPGWLDRIVRANGIAARWLGHASAAALLLMGAAVFYGVVMRFAFGRAQNWTDELATYSLASVVFLALAHTLTAGGHIRIEVLPGWLPPRGRAALECAVSLVGLAFALLLLLGCIDVVDNFARRGTRSTGGLGLPLLWPALPLVIGAAAFVVAMAVRAIEAGAALLGAGGREAGG